MGDIVDLKNQPVNLTEDFNFIEDLCRFSEGLLGENIIRRKYNFTEHTWTQLGENETIIEKIALGKIERIRDGSSARERAQQLFVNAPNVLGNILNDENTPVRGRIESARELRAIAAVGPEQKPAQDRFQITINIGDTTEYYDKSLQIDANDISSNTPPVKVVLSKEDDEDGNPA